MKIGIAVFGVILLGFSSANSLAQDAAAAPDPQPASASAVPEESAPVAEPVAETPAPGANVPSKDAEVVENVPLPPPSDVAAPDENEIQEVIVTANRRRQSVRDIPGSIAAISGESLENIKAQGLADYIKTVPGVTLVDRGTDGSSPIIRGIATNTSLVGGQFTQAPVGIYVDDLPFSDLFVPFTQPDLNPFDLERVEILKGPQGTLLGAGALAGAVRYILKKPDLFDWETKLSATVFSNEFSEGLSPVIAGAVNVPVGDTLGFRVVGLTREESGMIDEPDVNAKDVDKLKQDTARILGRWDASERLKLNALFFFQQSDRVNAPFADNPRTLERRNHIVLEQKSGLTGSNITANYDFDWASILSSSNYLTKEAINFVQGPAGIADVPADPDGDGGSNGPGTEEAGQMDAIRNQLDSETSGFFQEFRLFSPEGSDLQIFDWLKMQWLVGGAYQRSEQSLYQRQDAILVQDAVAQLPGLPVFPINTPIGPVSGAADDSSVIVVDLQSVASETSLFGEATFRLGKYLELTAGARKFDTKLNATGFIAGAQAIALDQSTQIPIDTGIEADGINPRFSIRVLFNENISAYALASKGFQFGGVQLNPPARALTTASGAGFVPYESSKLWNYELGLRAEFFDRKLRWDTTLFYLDWKDLQITITTEAAPGGACCGLTFGLTENVGKARSQGVETSLSLTPMRGLNFISSAAFIDSRTAVDFDSSDGFIVAGTRLPASPRFQMANVASYSTPIPFFGKVQGTASLTHTHTGTSFNDLQYRRQQGGYDTFDASFNLLKSDWGFVPDITLSVLNLADVRGVAAVNAARGARDTGYYFVRPRTMLLSLGVKF